MRGGEYNGNSFENVGCHGNKMEASDWSKFRYRPIELKIGRSIENSMLLVLESLVAMLTKRSFVWGTLLQLALVIIIILSNSTSAVNLSGTFLENYLTVHL